jgi:hypothetical protein
MPKTLKADAASYDASKQYQVRVIERITLTDHRMTLYPGKEYILRGDLVAELAAKIESATVAED